MPYNPCAAHSFDLKASLGRDEDLEGLSQTCLCLCEAAALIVLESPEPVWHTLDECVVGH
jgi:hypothetical protein